MFFNSAEEALLELPTFSLVIELSAWFHSFVEDSNDFNYSRVNCAIVENMNWLLHLRLWSIDPCMPHVKTAKAGREFVSSSAERPFGIGCDCSHRCSKKEPVPAPTVGSPSLGACRENVGKIALRRLR
jgi:hypothetical protein